jgi:hypothetical protein
MQNSWYAKYCGHINPRPISSPLMTVDTIFVEPFRSRSPFRTLPTFTIQGWMVWSGEPGSIVNIMIGTQSRMVGIKVSGSEILVPYENIIAHMAPASATAIRASRLLSTLIASCTPQRSASYAKMAPKKRPLLRNKVATPKHTPAAKIHNWASTHLVGSSRPLLLLVVHERM